MENNRKLVLEEKDIKDFEMIISNLPVFAKTVSENMLISQAINHLISWMDTKIIKEEIPSE